MQQELSLCQLTVCLWCFLMDNTSYVGGGGGVGEGTKLLGVNLSPNFLTFKDS
jgi:hypothetical protein